MRVAQSHSSGGSGSGARLWRCDRDEISRGRLFAQTMIATLLLFVFLILTKNTAKMPSAKTVKLNNGAEMPTIGLG